MSRIRFNERMRVVNESMSFYRLPAKLQERTRTRYEYAWKMYRAQEQDELMYALSPTLKRDVAVYLYQDMLKSVALFAECEPDVIGALCVCLTPQFFLEHDVLCREGAAGKEMYFLKCGVVTISQKSRGVLGHLDVSARPPRDPGSASESTEPRCLPTRAPSPHPPPSLTQAGEYFGEMCLLSSKVFGSKAFAMDRRTCSITAHTLVDVMVLSKANLETVVQDYPILLTQMLEIASNRLKELGEVARISSFRKVVGVACITALNSKRWLARSRANAATEHPTDRSSATESAQASHKPTIADPATTLQTPAVAPTSHDMATLMKAVQDMAQEMKDLRQEVQRLKG
jgi:CRP-like cAMP-binding protein